MKVKRCYLRLVSCFVLGFCLIFSSILHVNAQETGNPFGQAFNVTMTVPFSLSPVSSTPIKETYTESSSTTVSNYSYTVSLNEPTYTIISAAGTSGNSIQMDSPLSSGSQSGYFSFKLPSQTVPQHTTTGTITPSSNSGTETTTTTGTITAGNGVRHFDTDLEFDFNPLLYNMLWFNTSYDYIAVSGWDFSYSAGHGNLYNSKLTFDDGTRVATSSAKPFLKSNSKLVSGDTTYYSPTIHYTGHWSASYVDADLSRGTNVSVTVSFVIYIRDMSKDEVADTSSPVNDIRGNAIGQQGNALQEQNNTITQDTNTVTHDTNNKVTSFFGAFWDNLLHIFVPESGFFQQWFSDLNSFMSQKLGFLWSPFDFVISFLNGIYSSSGGSSPGIVFPGLTWIDGTVIIPQQTFSFDNIGGESFSDLRDMIYFATDVILLGAVVHQFYQKIKIVFEGGSD